MKKISLWAATIAVVVLTSFVWYSCTKDVAEAKGSIYGFVTDMATGEAVANANVILRQTDGAILTATMTSSDGMYEFLDVSNGEYRIKVTKVEYSDLVDDYVIVVSDGKKVRRDVQIEKQPTALRIVDGNGEDISVLDFGAEADVTSRTFSIFNDSPGDIRWWIIDVNCSWISEVKSVITGRQGGDIAAGHQEPIIVTIDRSALGTGQKTYILNINSDNGSRELTIMAGEDVGLPSLTTGDVSNLTQTSATFNGTILSEGTPAYTERGFVYSTSPQPTIENDLKITSAVNNQASFSANVSGLSPNTSYYVRAYARNTIGVAYGNDVAFATESVETRVSTSATTNISASSATLNGTIIEVGSPAYTEKGFCYNTTGNPTTSSTKVVVAGTSAGSYSTGVTNLEYQTTYYVRAYAIQNGQTKYGDVETFSTSWTSTQVQTSAASNVSATSATLNGSITEVGSPAYIERGFCYSTSNSSPTISNIKVIVTGTGSGNYSKNITNLDYQTTYYVRAYAIQNGQAIYGNAVNFTTTWTDAQVQTSAVTNISTTSAKFNGVVSNVGNPTYTERGFCYSTTVTQPTISNTKVVVSGTGSGNFYKNMTDLVSGETYYVRAYVIQNGVAIYGSAVNFTTNELPEVYTDNVSNLTPVMSAGITMSWNVTFNGHISSVGSPAYVERGFCYGTSMNPTGNRQIVSGSGTGTFTKSITGLSNYQTYYVRAYAKTSSGTYVYGQNVSFQTYDW